MQQGAIIPLSSQGRPARLSGLSGNEMYCAPLLGFEPGNLLVGNSVFSLGLLGSIGSSVRTLVGGEIKQYTEVISEGRRLPLQRFDEELVQSQGNGIFNLK